MIWCNSKYRDEQPGGIALYLDNGVFMVEEFTGDPQFPAQYYSVSGHESVM